MQIFAMSENSVSELLRFAWLSAKCWVIEAKLVGLTGPRSSRTKAKMLELVINWQNFLS